MSLFAEMKRRNVFRVALAYGVVAWLVVQIADVMIDNIGAPDWVFGTILMVLGIGFPIALVFAWAFEMTPEGLKREHEVDRSQSIAPQTGRKLDFLIIGVLAIAVVYLLADKFGAGPVSPDESTESSMVSSQTAAITDTVTETAPNSIAVLPFANRSRAEDDEFFVDGMHDDLLTQLAKIQGLKVISRTTMMQYKDSEKTIPEIAEELAVSAILEGGVQRAGDRVRINAQLIDPTGDGHIWAETYDREMTVENLFDIQSEITRHIVSAVRGELSEEEQDALAEQPTNNLAAYEAYLRGRADLNHPDYGIDRAYAALEWLQRAVDLDPEFAHAWARLSVAWSEVVWMAVDNEANRQSALDALERARALAPDDAETLVAEGAFEYRLNNDYRAATAHFKAAAEKAPNNSDVLVWLATAARRMDEWNTALFHLQTAVDLDPGNMWVKSSYSETLILNGAWERAEPMVDSWRINYPEIPTFTAHKISILLSKDGDVQQARDLLESVEPWNGVWYFITSVNTYMWSRDFQALVDHMNSDIMMATCNSGTWGYVCQQFLADAHHHLGQEETARHHASQALALAEADSAVTRQNEANRLASIAQARASLGEFDQAVATIEAAVQLLPESADSLDGRQLAITRAHILGRAGQREEALAEVQRLLRLPFGIPVMDLRLSPDWDYFRDDPRFVALYEDSAMPAQQRLGDGT